MDTTPYEKNGLTKDDVLEIKKVYDQLNDDPADDINNEDVKNWLTSKGVACDDALVKKVMEYDLNKNGTISLAEFYEMIYKHLSKKQAGDSWEKYAIACMSSYLA